MVQSRTAFLLIRCVVSFVFSQSRVKVSASLTNVGSLAVGAFDLVNCSLQSVVGFVSVFNVSL